LNAHNHPEAAPKPGLRCPGIKQRNSALSAGVSGLEVEEHWRPNTKVSGFLIETEQSHDLEHVIVDVANSQSHDLKHVIFDVGII
jgi:hypothetical protein